MSARGQPKVLSLRSRSAFYEGKRQAPLCEAQALSLPLASTARMSAVARAPRPDELWHTRFVLIINNKPDNKRQQTTTVDYKRLINGLVLTGFASLLGKTNKTHKYGNTRE